MRTENNLIISTEEARKLPRKERRRLARLNNLAWCKGTLSQAESMTEVFRRALAVYEEIMNVHDQNGRIVIEIPDRPREVLRIIQG